jgi:pyruvate dehydrogenase E2 component (dihydrolipoamide acetyltransferase)
MVEVMTDKVTVRISSPVNGKVSRLLFDEGKVAAVGSALIEIETDEVQPSEVPVEENKADIPIQQKQQQPQDTGRLVTASPAVRRIAREKGLNLSEITGTGENGRVTLDDLEAATKLHSTVKSPTVQERAVTSQALSGDTLLEPRGLRRLIFEKMTKSKEIMPHFTVAEEADITSLQEIVRKLSEMDTRVTLTAFFIKAAATVLKEFPYLNATYNEEKKNYTLRSAYNIGMAVDTEAGLTVPVIHDVDRKSIMVIAAEIRDLASKARESRLGLNEVQGGTFTVTNVGPIGGLFSTPIINYPEVAILGVHRAFKKDVEGNGRIMTYLSLSCDHRLIDGALATRFLMKLKAAIETPEYFLVR